MKRDIRKTFGHIIYTFHFCRHMKNRMYTSKSNGFFYKILKFFVFADIFPVYPTYWIILTPGIVISFLRVAKFISTIDQRNPLAEKQQKKRITKLLFPHFTDCLFPGGSFYTTIPGIIEFTAIMVAFSIGFVMSIIVGYRIIKGKSVLSCHIMYSS